MLKTEREKKICEKYKARDKDGFVHCNDCPLVIDINAFMCRATVHYNRHTREWEEDRQ